LRPLIFFILIFAWVSACAPNSKKHRKRYRIAYPAGQSVPKQKPNPSRPKSTSLPKTPIILGPVKTSSLPTILNEKDQTLMILINAGKYPAVKKNLPLVNLAAFYIDRTEITVSQFRKYQHGYKEKPFTNGKDCPTCPAMGINWIQASKYCRWAGKRLPQEAEWEAAARGVSNFTYPWGEIFLPQHSNLWGKEDGHLFAAPVGSFLSGASTSGLVDMVGNVWEWVDNKKSSRLQPNARVAKGGGWTSDKRQARISYRNHVDLQMNNPTFGFRCAKSLKQKR
jgi:formylglycine-generating enzyme